MGTFQRVENVENHRPICSSRAKGLRNPSRSNGLFLRLSHRGILLAKRGSDSSRHSDSDGNDRCSSHSRSHLWLFGARSDDRDAKGSQAKFFVSSGSYTVNPDSSVSVIAEEAAPLADFDKEKAMAALNSVASGPEGEIETATLSAIVAAL